MLSFQRFFLFLAILPAFGLNLSVCLAVNCCVDKVLAGILTRVLLVEGILGWGQFLGQIPRVTEHDGFTPWLRYSSTHHCQESVIQRRTCWAQDARLQLSYENRYLHFDISLWPFWPLTNWQTNKKNRIELLRYLEQVVIVNIWSLTNPWGPTAQQRAPRGGVTVHNRALNGPVPWDVGDGAPDLPTCGPPLHCFVSSVQKLKRWHQAFVV